MNKRNFFVGISLLLSSLMLIAGCSKDKYATKPSLKLKSVSSYDVAFGQTFIMRLEYTDAEGDLSSGDSSIIIKRIVTNCSAPTLVYAGYKLPEIPATKNASGDIVVRFENSTSNYLSQGFDSYNPSTCIRSQRPDTTFFRFFIRDKAGNISDSVSTDKPIIIRTN